MKKTLFILLVSLLIISISFSTKAHNFSVIISGNTFSFNIKDSVKKHVELTSNTTKYPNFHTKQSGSIIIPETIKHNAVTYSITSIGKNAFLGCKDLTSVILPNTITSIGDNAFDYCINLKSINISESITTIGENAFWGCINLIKIALPKTVTSIGDNAFTYCISLDTVIFNPINCSYMGSLESPVFKNSTKVSTLIIGNKVQTIPEYAFYRITRIDAINLPNSLISIGISAFDSCVYLKSITLPENVNSIGNNAFKNCYSLREIDFKAINCKSIGSNNALAFEGCEKIRSLIIGDNVTNIPPYSFSGISSLSHITANPIKAPTIQINSFNGVSKKIPISLSCISLKDYQRSNYWKSFSNYKVVKKTQFINASICQGEAYTDYGVNFNASGKYYLSHSCDSVILNLIVKPTTTTSLSDSICKGQIYSKFGFNFIAESSGLYSQNLQGINSCDSTVNLTLSVFSTYTKDIEASICEGETYSLNGFNESRQGYYTQNLKTINGCDSTINLNLIVNPLYNYEITEMLCQGETYNSNGFNQSRDGHYIQKLQTINGCDSIIKLNLIVNPIYDTVINASICQDEIYNQFGFNHSISGTFTQKLKTNYGCDSTITLNLKVNPTYKKHFEAEICQEEIYNLNGFKENKTGSYTQNLKTINGCDSIITLSLIVNKLNAPSNLNIDFIQDQFELSWEGDAETYLIYKDNCLIDSTKTRIYRDNDIIDKTTYCYRIVAIKGECEAESMEICHIFLESNDLIEE